MNADSAIYRVKNQCDSCARRTGTYRCEAFPGDGNTIPPLILFGIWDHTISYERDGQDDHGLKYVPKEEVKEPDHSVCTSDIALLAPVPKEHLVDGLWTLRTAHKVAFGSRNWDVFKRLDQVRDGTPVDVYIYESHGNSKHEPVVSWRARYVGFVGAVNGGHPEGMAFRPASTVSDSEDSLLFWEVDALQELQEQDRVQIGTFTSFAKKKPYSNSFVPRRPMLIQHP